MRALFVLSVLASACLMFLLQPLLARLLLPAFGGSPAVWNTCMVFFQVLLLSGYAYAHESVRRFGIEASKAHVATPSDDGLVSQRAMLMLGVIEEELAGPTATQPDPLSTAESFAAQS